MIVFPSQDPWNDWGLPHHTIPMCLPTLILEILITPILRAGISAAENRSWPGKPLLRREGDKIKQYGDTQAREIAWLERQVQEGAFQRNRVQYRSIVTLDEIRAVTQEGDEYRGEWNLQGQHHGEGRLKYADGGLYTGPFQEGKRHGEGFYTDPKGDWTRAIWQEGAIEGDPLEDGKKGTKPQMI